MLDEGPLGRKQFGNLRVYKGAEHPHEAQKPETLDIAAMNRKNVRSAVMADTVQSLEGLGGAEARGSREAPKHVQKLDKQGRAYATGKRKNAVARVWLKPGSGKIVINEKTIDVYFARPVLRMLIQQPFVIVEPRRPIRRELHSVRRRTFRPGGRVAPRHLESAHFLRAGFARRAQEGRLHDPRFPRGRAQEVRSQESPPELPVLEALIGADRGKSKRALSKKLPAPGTPPD